MLTIDGSFGQGGGQIIRTSLALSLVTGKPFHVERVRARRDKPGLRQQHLTAVNAAASVGHATVEGAAVGSTEFDFAPETSLKSRIQHVPCYSCNSWIRFFRLHKNGPRNTRSTRNNTKRRSPAFATSHKL